MKPSPDQAFSSNKIGVKSTDSDNRSSFKILILLMGFSPNDTGAPSTRVQHLYTELLKYFPETFLLMKGDGNGCESSHDAHFQTICPKVKIEGSFRLFKETIFRIQMAFQIMTFLKKRSCNRIILRGYDTVLLYPFLKLWNIKTFFDFHGLYDLELKGQNRYLRALFVKLCYEIIFRLSDIILVVSKGVEDQIPKYRNKCLLLQNGVDIEKIQNITDAKPIVKISDDAFVAGFIGNWANQMKIEDICDAVQMLENAVGLIIGDGYQTDVIKARYNNGDKIIFTGRINLSYVYPLLRRIDVCIIPYDESFYMSKIKGFFSNRKIFEYMAAGKPIISSDIEGKPDFLKENINCLLYSSGHPEELAEKIRCLMDSPILADRLGRENYKLAHYFTWERLIETSGLLDELRSE